MKTHELKTLPPFFDRVFSGDKTFELRRNDRDFQVGDVLVLREWENDCDWKKLDVGAYTGRKIWARIVYVLTQAPGLRSTYAILGIVVDAAEPPP